jgi:hypothetical protein
LRRGESCGGEQEREAEGCGSDAFRGLGQAILQLIACRRKPPMNGGPIGVSYRCISDWH